MLAVINWIRMGLINKAVIHLFASTVGTLAFIVLLMRLPGNASNCLGVMVNIILLIYIYDQMKKDIVAFKASGHEVQNAHWLMGILISIVSLGLYFVLAFIVAVFMVFFNVPIPE